MKESEEIHEGVSKSFRTGRLERELQMVQLSATILWVNLVSLAAITLCVASQRLFVIDSDRKLLDTPSYKICTYSVIFRWYLDATGSISYKAV